MNAVLRWILPLLILGLLSLPLQAQDAANPSAPLVKSGGFFYGASYNGGSSNQGTVFKMDMAGNVTVLHSFTGPDGAQCIAKLTEDNANPGTFYGVTRYGGANNKGAIYKITAAGAFTILASFNGTNGAEPQHGAALVQSGSLFYGTTGIGGSNNLGTVYKFDPATNTITVLHSFVGSDGNLPLAGLILASDGKLYGTTSSGGANNKGAVFQITTSGTYTLLRSFAGTDGAKPHGNLLQVGSGTPPTFLGVTENGGGSDRGTAFQITATGGFTLLHSFTGADGDAPNVGLTFNGSFYFGSTLFGGAFGKGNLFKMDGAGNVTSLYSFNGTDGQFPDGDLFWNTSDGLFYSTTFNGGQFGNGMAYRMDTAGNLTILHHFGFSLASLSVSPSAVVGGNPPTGTATGLVTMNGPAPVDTTVTLSSPNPTVASVPASVVVRAGTSSAQFPINTSAVASTTAVPIQATYGATSSATLTVTSSAALYRVNCGGGAVGGFAADSFFSGGTTYSTANTIDTTTVTDPAPQAVYQSGRSATTSFTYTFPGLTVGAFYTVRLHFADVSSTGINQRLINIVLNGAQVATNLDVFAVVGGANKALVREYTAITNSSGQVVVTFSPGNANPAICSGIEIMPRNPDPPTNLEAYATANGKITLYWDAMPGAMGYNVYRGTTEGGEDYVHPVNGTTPITTLSYPGSSRVMFSNTGLVNGTVYSYTVKAIYSTGMSAPSIEDSEVPDAQGIPWDTRNPGSILASIRNAFAADVPNPGSLHVVGPDGTVYDDSSALPLPPDGQILSDTATFQLTSGEQLQLPVGGSDADLSGSTVSNWPGTHGPTRRVVSTPGYRGVQGDFFLPHPQLHTTSLGKERAEVHLGSHLRYPPGSKNSGRTDEVDAGLTSGDNPGWGLFLNTNGKYAVAKVGDPKSQIKWATGVHVINRFTEGTTVNLAFYAYANQAGPVSQRRVCLIVAGPSPISAADPMDVVMIAAPTKLTRNTNDLNYLVLKRVHAIAQPFPSGTIDRSNIIVTGSSWTGVIWGQSGNSIAGDEGPGRLLTTANTWVPWTVNTTYRPGFPSTNFEPYLQAQPGTYVGFPTAQARVNVQLNRAYSWETVDIFCNP